MNQASQTTPRDEKAGRTGLSWKAALVAPLGAAIAGAAIYGAARLGRFTGNVGIYYAVVFGFFFTLYYLIPGGFKAHFNVPAGVDPTAADVAYFTVVAGTGCGFGDITGSTRVARILVTLQLIMVFAGVANIVPLGGTTFSYSQFVAE